MEYTRLGSSGLKISRVAMGTMSFGEGDSGREGWPIPYEDAVPFFRQALDLLIPNKGRQRLVRWRNGHHESRALVFPDLDQLRHQPGRNLAQSRHKRFVFRSFSAR